MSEKINILCATDDNYATYCGVMLTSLFENNHDREVEVYIMVSAELQEVNRNKIDSLSKKYGGKINWVVVKDSIFEEYPIQGEDKKYLSLLTYYRMYAADLLPAYVSKVLYLDCDTIVNRPIGELFDMNWDGYAVGAIPDMCTEWQEYYDRLGYDKSKGYFNAGVLMMNLDYWRKNNICQECINFLTSHYKILLNNDQDMLNVVTCNCKKNLPISYNFQIQLRYPYFYSTFNNAMKQEVAGTNNPHIIHYAAELKPWMTKYYAYPFNREWHYYKKKSPWRNTKDLLPKKRTFIGFVNRYILWPVGINIKKPDLI